MKVILTSSIGGSRKVEGVRVPAEISAYNGLLDRLKADWVPNAKVLLICSASSEHEKNDSMCSCLKEAFPMSGLSISYIDICDDRNMDVIEKLDDMDVLILVGGHVPTQNRFMKQIRLRERLMNYDGVVIGWSAGSMNCADVVYAGPELEGEAVDPTYERWITGLGLTDINIFPHFQYLRDDILDGMRLIEDITFEDSVGHEIIAINEESYIVIEDGQATLYGEAYRIKDKQMTQICKEGECIRL